MMLMQLPPGDPHLGDLEEIQKAAKRSADLTRQLLAFARKQTISPRVLNLNDTVEGMLRMLRRLIGEDIHLVWQPDADLWPVKMDPAQIDQILVNLCVNARDVISGTGKVTIETENVVLDEDYCAAHADFHPGAYVMLAVSDDGCGMDRETLDKVFDPFFTTKEVGKGTGLGLSTVYGIVKQNDGFINVYSELRKGTTFKIYIPRHEGDLAAAEVAKPSEIPRGQGETVLLVEDDPGILSMGKKMLERLGYRVIMGATPEDAVEQAQGSAGPVHLLVTDVVMPQMSGKDLAEKIKTFQPGIRVLFMSGYTANVIAHHGVLDDTVHFMEKPFSLNVLAQKVREVLESAPPAPGD
jgi:CheY-like chemotaxis protein